MHSEEDRMCGKGQGKESTSELWRMRQAYKISHLPVPAGRRLHRIIFPVKGNAEMFKKQPAAIRVIIPGCSQRKGGNRRVMRQLVNTAGSLELRVADKHNINVLRARLPGTQL